MAAHLGSPPTPPPLGPSLIASPIPTPSPSVTLYPSQMSRKDQPKVFSAKKQRLFNSRTIRSESVDPAFVEGKLDVPSFILSREYEIRQLEHAQLRSRASASTRVFQSLPRTLRRRAASHNVKRIPKRLRGRALREMANQNPEKKTGVSRGHERYRAQVQVRLLRLAAKRKLMEPGMTMGRLTTRQRIKQLRSAPSSTVLNNRMGSVDHLAVGVLAAAPAGNIKYQKRQRTHVWLPTHVWHTKRAHLVKKWGFQIPLKPTQKCFRAIHRSSVMDGGVVFDTSYFGTCVLSGAPANLRALVATLTNGKAVGRFETRTWCGLVYQDAKPAGEGMVMWTPGAGLVVLRLHPSIYSEYFRYVVTVAQSQTCEAADCRYALGSLTITGPVALPALGKVFHPVDRNCEAVQNWFQAASVSDVSTIPLGTTFAFDIYDPRLWGKPTTMRAREVNHNDLIIALHGDASRGLQPGVMERLLSSEGRTASYARQATLSELGKRRALHPGQPIAPAGDPSVPVVVTKTSRNQWVVLLPWFWVVPVWHVLTRVPHLRLGGARQLHQLAFEQGSLFYPTDYPFLREGALEARLHLQALEQKWQRTPSGKRVNYAKAVAGGEHGSPFGCDWRYLQLVHRALERLDKSAAPYFGPDIAVAVYDGMERQIKLMRDVALVVAQAMRLDRERAAPALAVVLDTPGVALRELLSVSLAPLPVIPISLSVVQRGEVKDHARIYRLSPETYAETVLALKQAREVECPGFENLIGFITSGTFNLGAGSATGVGCITASWATQAPGEYVLVRNVGTSKGWLARWTPLHL